MAEKILMLALSPTMEKGMIGSWIKNVGDAVVNGDVLCEVETDKTTMEYESPADGILLKILVQEGEEAAIGDLIAIIGEANEDISALLEETSAAAETAAAGAVAPDMPAAEDSEPSDVAADTEPEAAPVDLPHAAQPAAAPAAASTDDFVKASPLARRLAKMNNLLLSSIRGSGPAGRVVKADIDKALNDLASAPTTAAGTATAPAASASGGDQTLPVSNMRKVIARRLAESKYSAPHYYLKVSVELDRILEELRQMNEKADSKISLNAFIIKFVAEALKKHPGVNAGWNGDTITLFGSVDVGVAVALDDGLITPVLRNAGNKGIVQIDRELKDLIDKARSNRLQPAEYSGASFTISNLGMFGIEDFTAIINPPGSAILAVGAFKKEPVVQPDDTLEIRSIMRLSLSCDHRVIDGAVGAQFLRELKEMLESPIRALY